IRLDANGAWKPDEAGEKMERFARSGIHSIEQPIAPGQLEDLARLCRDSAIPVALDEELIGISDPVERSALLGQVRPAYVILKPGLLGGFSVVSHWISLAETLRTGWWITSALESNIGLNAIAQWTWQLGVTRHQGLGTGALYTNNIASPLVCSGEQLWFRPENRWDLNSITL
ncbi:MAG: o-succinylbenzoate synthase, partial [Actinomycetia bacterium]|nr:o-succinylbenzoate synthase [Actinomycetes bacterium]